MKKGYTRNLIILAMMGVGVLPGMSAYAAPPAISAGDAAVLADGGNQANAIMRKNQWQDRQWMQKQVAAGEKMKSEPQETEEKNQAFDASEKIKVSSFHIIGQDIYPEETLRALLSDYQGKDMSFSDLQKGADRITSFFRSHGYIVARAVIPQQDVTNGTVTYQVEVGRFDTPEIINHTKIKDTAVQHQAQAIREGEYVTRERLERAVWLVSDMADADARVALSPGKDPGTVHVTLTVEPYETKHGLVTADNYGSRAMGYNEYGINYDFTNPNLYGDHFMTGISTSGRHMFNWGVNYRTPLSRDGLNLLAGYNVFSYDMGDEWEIYDGVGTSRTASIGLEYALRRSRLHNLYTGLRLEHSRIKDEYRAFDATYGDKNGNAMVLSLRGDDQDTEGMTDWTLEWKLGHISNAAFTSDNIYSRWMAGDPRTAGDYSKLRGSIERHQNINERTYLLLSAFGQYAFSDLDSSEHFSLGGPYGVKAYPTSEASGDSGYITRAELRWLIPLKAYEQQFHLAVYAEHGGIWYNHHSDINPGVRNHRNLQGAGIGLIWQRHQDWFLRMDYAWKLGAEDPESDTRHKNGQFWIRGGFYF